MQNREPTASLDQLPWWVRAIVLLGAPAAIAVYLTWFVTYDLKASIYQLETNQSTIANAVDLHRQDQGDSFKRLEYLLRSICINTAKNDQDRADCNFVPSLHAR